MPPFSYLTVSFFSFLFTLNTPGEKRIPTTLSALMINIITPSFSLSRHYYYYYYLLYTNCDYLHVQCGRRAVCIATAIIRVRAIDPLIGACVRREIRRHRADLRPDREETRVSSDSD